MSFNQQVATFKCSPGIVQTLLHKYYSLKNKLISLTAEKLLTESGNMAVVYLPMTSHSYIWGAVPKIQTSFQTSALRIAFLIQHTCCVCFHDIWVYAHLLWPCPPLREPRTPATSRSEPDTPPDLQTVLLWAPSSFC